MIDSPPPIDGATHGNITVTTLDYNNNNAPVAGIAVVAINPDGTVAVDMTSDAQGKVPAVVDAGASVTAVYVRVSGTTTTHTPITIYDVHPGDNLVIGSSLLDSSTDGTFNVTFPAYSASYAYTVYGPCGQASGAPNTPVQLSFSKNCHPATFDLYVTATYPGATGPYEVMEKKGVAAAVGSTIAINGVWASTNNFTSGYIDVPSTITNISTARYAGGSSGYQSGGNGAPANSVYAFTMNYQPRVGSGALVETTFKRAVPAGVASSQQGMYQFIDPNADAYELDVAQNTIPWVDAITFDKPTATLHSTLTGTGKYDQTLIQVQYTLAAGGNVQWLAFGPKADTIQLPTLPAHLMVPTPAAADTVTDLVTYLLAADDFADWDAIRQRPIDQFAVVLQGFTKGTAHFSAAAVRPPVAKVHP